MKNCTEVPHGNGFCDRCKEGRVDLCRYVNTVGASKEIDSLRAELDKTKARLQEEVAVGYCGKHGRQNLNEDSPDGPRCPECLVVELRTELAKAQKENKQKSAHLDERHARVAELKSRAEAAEARVKELEAALMPKPLPEGLVPHAYGLASTIQNADYWYKAGHEEPNTAKAVMHMAQAMFAWKNAALSQAERLMAAEARIKELELSLSEQYVKGMEEAAEIANDFDHADVAVLRINARISEIKQAAESKEEKV